MPGRSFSSNGYRYGFNGQEKDDEVKGSGNSIDLGARIQDPRLGRFLSVDPLQTKYASKTPYHFCSDNPTNRIDGNGKDDFIFHTLIYATTYQINGETKITTRKVNSVEVIKTNTANTYTAHNVVVTEDLTNSTTTVSESSKNVRGDAGKYLSENWDAVSAQYPQQISAQGENSGTQNYADARARKNNYEFNKHEDEINIAALSLMSSFIPFEAFAAEMIAIKQANLVAKGEFVNRSYQNIRPWLRYQSQVTNSGIGTTFKFGGVEFDGAVNGALIEAKGVGTLSAMKKYGDKLSNMLGQARDQLSAAGGNPIEWHFAEKEAASIFEKALSKEGISGIKVTHTPMNWAK